MPTIQPFLMFEGKAEEAMNYYIGLFPDSAINEIHRYGAEDPGAMGSVLKANFTVSGQTVLCTDSPAHHAFTFTPAFSLFVTCGSEEEFGRYFASLSNGGAILMPPDNYGFSRRFAWVNDRSGVSWQMNLP